MKITPLYRDIESGITKNTDMEDHMWEIMENNFPGGQAKGYPVIHRCVEYNPYLRTSGNNNKQVERLQSDPPGAIYRFREFCFSGARVFAIRTDGRTPCVKIFGRRGLVGQ